VSPPDFPLDKRFVYYLLGSAGICVVPLSSFCTEELGFRITLLEPDRDEFTQIFRTIAAKIEEYLASARSEGPRGSAPAVRPLCAPVRAAV
jgi:aspartate/methionine/tyrosine aminotransferase